MYYYYKKPNSKNNFEYSAEVKEYSNPKNFEKPRLPEKEYDFFSDHFINTDPPIHLSPQEARQELKYRKSYGDYLTDEEYYGYMDVIHSGKDDDYLNLIWDMEPEKAMKWFLKKKENGTWLTQTVMLALKDKLAPYHEPILLELLQKVPNGRVIGWVNARKKEGYFFSDTVYEACRVKNAIYQSKKSKL